MAVAGEDEVSLLPRERHHPCGNRMELSLSLSLSLSPSLSLPLPLTPTHSLPLHIHRNSKPIHLSPSPTSLLCPTVENHDRGFAVVGAVVLKPVHTEAMQRTGVEEGPTTSNRVVTQHLKQTNRQTNKQTCTHTQVENDGCIER